MNEQVENKEGYVYTAGYFNPNASDEANESLTTDHGTKIGITIDPPQREKELGRTNGPIGVQLLRCWKYPIANYSKVEKHFHTVFDMDPSATGGTSEWSREDRDYIYNVIESFNDACGMDVEEIDVKEFQSKSFRKSNSSKEQQMVPLKELWESNKEHFSKKYTGIDDLPSSYIGSGVLTDSDGETIRKSSINIMAKTGWYGIDFHGSAFDKQSLQEYFYNNRKSIICDNMDRTDEKFVLKSPTGTLDSTFEIYKTVKEAVANDVIQLKEVA